MDEAGYDYQVIVPDIEEIHDTAIPIRELTAMNAKIKAQAIAPQHPESIIIAGDTLVLHDDEPLGKPADMEEAAAMLARLNGQTHEVHTAVCLIREASDQVVEFSVATEVTFYDLTPEQQAAYHSLIEPLDKAGAYAAQDHGELIIEKSVGSQTNVIGLPMEALAEHLESTFGVKTQFS